MSTDPSAAGSLSTGPSARVLQAGSPLDDFAAVEVARDKIETILTATTFENFGSFPTSSHHARGDEGGLETGPHDNVHGSVGGSMSRFMSPTDPVFWAHHAMIDRLWRLWQLAHPGGLPPATVLGAALPPFPLTVGQTLDTTALGYDYAVSTTSAT